jgi:predicted aconitase
MHLTAVEERILAGEEGQGRQKAMELLVALGRIYDADELIPITSAHLSGVSYKTIGEGGIGFLEEMSSARVVVPTTLNPAGMDTVRWKEMGVEEDFARRQLRILDLYRGLGVKANCSCTPYLLGNAPGRGETIAWAESSALSFANSVLAARTNREGGPGALAAAVLGRTPRYGLHLEENRRPTIVIDASIGETTSDFSLLGHVIGSRFGAAVPYFRGIRPGFNELKIMAAAMAAAGSVAMFHVEGVTPEASGCDLAGVQKASIERKDLLAARDSMSNGSEPDLIALGCPHLSESELKRFASVLDGRRKRGDAEVWFCTSRSIYLRCPKERAVLERFGKVVCDTCMIVAPIETRHRCTATNSCKACSYLPGLCSQKVLCRSEAELMEMIS